MKPINREIGKRMVHGEFESMKAIYEVSPTFTPKPVAWGTYQCLPDTHFFLCEFRNMKEEKPDPGEFGSRLAALHQDSQSPNGKFGFHVATYSGNLPQVNDWEDSWEVFFTKNLKLALKFEIEAKGPDPELDTLLPVLFDKVIPRLLRPLESGGRSVKPSLVHGDLWYGNSGIDTITGELLIFDACCFYAHNECKLYSLRMTTRGSYIERLHCDADEFGQWMPACNRFGPEYREAYHSSVEISHPKEDYKGRLDLYKL